MSSLRHRSTQAQALCMSWQVMQQIEDTIGDLPAERGGVLGGSRDDGIVRAFHFDRSARCSGATYSPDTAALRELFARSWNPRGIRMLGFVHSHPPGVPHPSGGDLAYARRIFAANPDLRRLLLPIVVTTADTKIFELLPFAATLADDGSVCIGPLTLVLGEFRLTRGARALRNLAKPRSYRAICQKEHAEEDSDV